MKLFVSVVLNSLMAMAFAGLEPIIMIHGLAGSPWNWGYYDVLNDAGFQTFRVSVTKFGSNWHRAIEAFAQVKGTTVDYGACHSDEYDEDRYGKDYTGKGMYPVWDADHPVHVFGHSQGGPTMRMLERLLREGSGCAQDTHMVLTGGKKWITSLSSFSGVLDGASTLDLGLSWPNIDEMAIDLNDPERDAEYQRRLGDKSALPEPRNLQLGIDNWIYDLTTEQCREFNAAGPLEYPDTYYFAFATERTDPYEDCWFFDCETKEEASWYMTVLFWPTAGIVGSEAASHQRKNDGLVSWVDQLCPNVVDSTRDRCLEYDGVWNIGQWYYMDLYFMDHIQVAFYNPIQDTVDYSKSGKKLYVDHGARLAALP